MVFHSHLLWVLAPRVLPITILPERWALTRLNSSILLSRSKKRQTPPWPGYFLTRPEVIFFDPKGIFRGHFPNLNPNQRCLTQTDPGSKNFDLVWCSIITPICLALLSINSAVLILFLIGKIMTGLANLIFRPQHIRLVIMLKYYKEQTLKKNVIECIIYKVWICIGYILKSQILNFFPSGQKVPGTKIGRHLIYCRSKVCSGPVASGQNSNCRTDNRVLLT